MDYQDNSKAEISRNQQEELICRQSSILSNISDVIGILGADGIMKYISPNIEKWFGWHPEEIIGTDGWFTAPYEDIERIKKEYFTLLQKDNLTITIESRYKCKDGSIKPIKLTATNLLNDHVIQGVLINFHDITRRKLAEDSVRLSEQKYRLLAEFSSDVIWVLNLSKNRFLYISPSIYQLRGFTVEEAMTETMDDTLTKDSLADVQKVIAVNVWEFINNPVNPKTYIVEVQQICKDGSVICVEISCKLRFNELNEIEIVGVSRNIGKRKLIEQSLKTSEENFRTFFSSLADLIFIMDSNYLIVDVNQTVLNRLEYEKDELVGQSVLNVFPSSQKEDVIYSFNSIRKLTLDYCHVPVVSKSGFKIQCETRVQRGIWNGKPALFAIVKDVTKIKQSEEKFSRAFQSGSNLMAIFNAKTNKFIDANDLFIKELGYSKDEIIGKTSKELNIFDDHRELDHIVSGKKSKSTVKDIELKIRTKTGKNIIGLYSASSIYVGNERCWLITITNITDRIQAEKEIKLKNDQLLKLNAEKDKFFSIISHDLRSPFNGFLGLTQIMAEELSSFTIPEIQNIVVTMRDSATNLFRLLENLLHWAKMQQGLIPFNPEIIQLISVVDESIEMLNVASKSKKIKITCDISNEIAVFADSNMLKTVFRNLISNAIKFTHKGGKIHVYAKITSNEMVEVSVNDSGIGMDSSMIENLFRLDAQINRKGTDGELSTGLGLVLCKEFIEKSGGKFWVKSEESKGSTFSFTLKRKTLPVTITKPSIPKSIFLGLIVLFFSCSSPQIKIMDTVSKPKVFIAKGYMVPKDSISAPVIISAGKPLLTYVKLTDEKLKISNIHPAVGLGRSKALTPTICTMGANGFTFPKVVIPIEKHVFCLPPQVVLVKDAYVKDINPQNFSSFSKLQGLLHDQIRSMIQDRMGNIWMGTDDGLTKYDGKYFSHYTTNQGLKNNLILSVFQDSKGNIWFGTFGGGITKYDGRYLTCFTTSEGFLNNVANSIFEDKIGNLWFGTGGGAVKYDGKFFTNFTTEEGLCHNDVRSITQDDSGRIWIATNGNGISVFDGKSFSNYSEKEGLIQNFINCMFKDSSNNIWLGTASEGIIKYDGVNFSVYSVKEGLSNNMIRSIIQDAEGNMWFGTSGGGISKFDGRYFTYYTESEGLSSNTIRSALKDSNGNLWFGTRGGGVARFDGRRFTHVTVNEGLSNNKIMNILQDNTGNLWFATFGDYVTIQSTRVVNGISHNYFTQFGKKEGLLNTRVYSIIQDKNANIWFGSDGGGISRLSRDSKTLATYTNAQGLCGNTVRKIYQDREGNFWIATYGNGISKFDGKTFTNYSKKEGLGSNNILSIIQDNNNNLWFGTDDNGVTRFDGINFTHFKKRDGLSNVVYTILQDNNGSLWFGTGGDGVIKYDGINFTNFTDKEGLNNNHVLSILQDMQNNLWFGTRFGLNVLKAEYFERNRKYPGMPWFKNFGYEEGFLGIGCNMGAICEDESGIIRIGTNDRMTKFRAEDELIDSIPPNIQITNVQLFNEDIPWTELEGKEDTTIALHNGVNVGKFKFNGISEWYGLPQKLSLDYKNNYVTFNFIGISQTQTNKIKYQFKLEGLDENWNIPTNRTEASYGNLNYGNYNFKVKAMNCEGYWSNEVSYQFTIRPPWWKTRLFYFSLVFALTLIIYGFMKYRERKLEHDKQLLQIKVEAQTFELTEKNKELQIHNATKDKFFSIIAHDLRGPFSGFLGLTEIMVEDLPSLSMKDIHDIAISMKHSATNLFRLLENLLQWARIQRGLIPFNPEVIELLPIVRESVDLLYETSKSKEIEITYIFPSHLKGFADSNLLQTVIRNLVSNAVKFTPKGGKILISASQTDEKTVEIAIKDSGIGMSSSIIDRIFRLDGQTNRKGTEGEPSTGLGLLLCKEFVEKHGGKLWAESVEGKGSTFYFTIPS